MLYEVITRPADQYSGQYPGASGGTRPVEYRREQRSQQSTTVQHPGNTAGPGSGTCARQHRRLRRRARRAAAGVAIGTAHVCESGALQVPEYNIAESGTADESYNFV